MRATKRHQTGLLLHVIAVPGLDAIVILRVLGYVPNSSVTRILPRFVRSPPLCPFSPCSWSGSQYRSVVYPDNRPGVDRRAHPLCRGRAGLSPGASHPPSFVRESGWASACRREVRNAGTCQARQWHRHGTAEGVAEGVAHNDVADGAADAQKVREVALRVPAASPVLDGWAAPAGEGAEDAPLAEELRPRVRLRSVGAEALSAAELLAVLLSAFPGTTEARALELAGRAISERGGLHGLLRSSVHEIMGTVGLGEAKASALLVAAELGKRMVSEPGPRRPVISGPPDVDALLRGRMAHLDRERFVVVLLNTKNAVIASPTVSIGTLSSSLVHPSAFPEQDSCEAV